MGVPNLAPDYLSRVKSISAQREENERDRAFQSKQASANFLKGIAGNALSTVFGIGGDIAGSAFRDSLTKDERSAAAGTYYPDDDVMGDNAAAIRQAAESRATAELRPQASFGGAAETGFGRRVIDTGVSRLGGAKADVLQPKPAVTPLIQQLRASDPVQRPEYASAFDPSGLAPRGMESEAPRRPAAPPPSPMTSRPAPMQPRESREAPGGYQPPRMMPSATAAMAREAGYRDAIPSLPTSVRGLAQQSQDVRDERSLGLELMRKKLLWEEQQAAANVRMMEQRGASATAIAAARGKEADAKAKAEEMRQLDLLMSARSRGAPKYVKGLGVYTPPQTVLPTGNTDDGLRGDIVPQARMGRMGGGGTGRGGGNGANAGDEPTGDALTLVVQTRDKKGNAVGPSQPRRIQVGPPLFRAVALSPVDYGFEKAEDMTRFKEHFRAYNEALPGAKKGDPAAVDRAVAAQEAMTQAIGAAQSKYAPSVAATREGFGTSPQDKELAAVRSDQAALRDEIAALGRARGQAKIAGGAIADTAALALPPEVTLDEVADIVDQDAGIVPGRKDRYQSTVDGSTLERAEYQAALRGAPMPDGLEGGAAELYQQVAKRAADAKTKLLAQKNSLRDKRLRAIVTELSADTDDPVGYLEGLGVVVPESLKPAPLPSGARPAAPRVAPRPAPAAQAGTSPAPTTPKFATLEDASDWVRGKPWSSDVKRATLKAIQAEQGL